MLTKEERKAIAKRLNYCGDTDYYSFYRAVTGHNTTARITLDEDIKELEKVISNLCDTSNMVELPLDKDGQVIRVGDTVFDDYGGKWEINGIAFKSNGVIIDTFLEGECDRFLPSQLTHKQPVTVKSLAQRIKNVLEDEATSIGVNPYVELGRIAEQLESLGDSGEE